MYAMKIDSKTDGCDQFFVHVAGVDVLATRRPNEEVVTITNPDMSSYRYAAYIANMVRLAISDHLI